MEFNNKYRMEMRTKLFDALKKLNEWQNVCDEAHDLLELIRKEEKYGIQPTQEYEKLTKLNEAQLVLSGEFKEKIEGL